MEESNLPTPPLISVESVESVESVVIKKPIGRPRKHPVKDPNKPKRVQTDLQKANFLKCIEVRKQNIEMRKTKAL